MWVTVLTMPSNLLNLFIDFFPLIFGLIGFFGGLYYFRNARKIFEKQKRHYTRSMKQLTEKLEHSEKERAKFSSMLNHMSEGLIAVDLDKNIIAMNPSAEKMFAKSRVASIGKSLIEIVQNSTVEKMADEAMENQTIIRKEISRTLPELQFFEVTAIGTQKGEGAVCTILVFQENTQVRKLESHRREFVTNVSHELKTPLTSLQGFIETLLGGALKDTEKSESFLKIMEDDAKRLSRLVADLLDLSKIESRELPLKPVPLQLADLIQQALRLFEPQLAQKKIQVENKIPRNLPVVHADPDKIKQLLVNLMDNAVKFNQEGGKIIITSENFPNKIKIAVQDNGIGIPEKDIHRIFERFFRVDKARSREFGGGTGLGLSIAKHIVEAHGGTISCQSKPGEGSTFTFSLPKLSS